MESNEYDHHTQEISENEEYEHQMHIRALEKANGIKPKWLSVTYKSWEIDLSIDIKGNLDFYEIHEYLF